MEWLFLCSFVPLVVVPVVLLAGFAGCAQIAGLESPGEPPPPATLRATAVGTTGVRLDWTPPQASAFFVERALGADSGVGTFVAVNSTVTGAPWVDTVTTGLTEGTTYTYRLRNETGLSNPVRVTTKPNAPTDLETAFSGPGRVRIQWIKQSANKDVEFRTERRTLAPVDSGSFQQLAPTTKKSYFEDTEAPVDKLVSGSKHEYRVVAVIPKERAFDNDAEKAAESDPSALLTVNIV